MSKTDNSECRKHVDDVDYGPVFSDGTVTSAVC